MPRKLDLETMREAARERGGACVSASYVGVSKKLEWECIAGHRWLALPSSVRQGHWCKRCADDRRRKSMGEMSALATQKAGELVSTTYVNTQTRMRWRCGRGHEWEAIPNSIRRGTWCPRCAQSTKSRRFSARDGSRPRSPAGSRRASS